MTKQEWNNCRSISKLYDYANKGLSKRKHYLFAVACCKRISHMFDEPLLDRGVELAELLAEGEIFHPHQDLVHLREVLWSLMGGAERTSTQVEYELANAVYFAISYYPRRCSESAAKAVSFTYPHARRNTKGALTRGSVLTRERAWQAKMFRHIVPYPGD